MARLSISEAIRRSGVSRATFYNKYINAEKNPISVSKDENGKKYIDSSELLRVFGKLSDKQSAKQLVKPDPKPEGIPENSSDSLHVQVARLEVENKMLREKLDDQDKHYGKQIALLEYVVENQRPWYQFWKSKK